MTEEYSILAQISLDPSPMAQRIIDEHQSDVRSLFDKEFESALPTVPTGELQLRIGHTNAAAWGLLGQPRMLERMNVPSGAQATLKQVFDSFLEFAVAGMTHDEISGSPARTRPRKNRKKTAATAKRKRVSTTARVNRRRQPNLQTRREI